MDCRLGPALGAKVLEPTDFMQRFGFTVRFLPNRVETPIMFPQRIVRYSADFNYRFRCFCMRFVRSPFADSVHATKGALLIMSLPFSVHDHARGGLICRFVGSDKILAR
jgi:hypothetical protein